MTSKWTQCWLFLILLVISAACQAAPAASPPVSPPTPPSPGPVMSPTELKYALIGRFGGVFFCDPDYYPIAREGQEEQRAAEQFPALQAQTEEFQAIARHNNLQGVASFTDEQKLLVYREHKKLSAVRVEPSGAAYSFGLRVEQQGQKLQGLAIEGTINAQGTITVTKQEPTFATCPICLAGGTRIQVPGGETAAADLRPGMTVWTVDAAGHRVAEPILEVTRRPVPIQHQMVQLRLDDGRELVASAAHPLTDGRVMGGLRTGDRVDGSTVASATTIDWNEAATYDLLPAGATGWYWANGILIGSTIRQQ